MTRRLHEYELEIRRLENEREELTAAYKEAEAVRIFTNFKNISTFFLSFQGRKAEEKRSQAMASEFGVFRHEAERRIAIKEEEVETIRWVLKKNLCMLSTRHFFPVSCVSRENVN